MSRDDQIIRAAQLLAVEVTGGGKSNQGHEDLTVALLTIWHTYQEQVKHLDRIATALEKIESEGILVVQP